jgi:hypothetical protein
MRVESYVEAMGEVDGRVKDSNAYRDAIESLTALRSYLNEMQ